ncbi:MAG: autotransporter domain-containing protein [Opitutaceae bacterium]
MDELGFLEGGEFGLASGVSADGSVVVGYSNSTAGGSQAFRWKDGVMDGLGFLEGGDYSWATGASADGSVVVGYSNSTAGGQAFRWENGVMDGLGFLEDGDYSWATGVSADGSVVVGYSESTAGRQAFRWKDDVMDGLGFLEGGDTSWASGVSADGSVVVGYSDSTAGYQAFRWKDGVMEGLGFLEGGDYGNASGVSVVGGSIVLESGQSTASRQASSSNASGVSADGSVVVGQSASTAGYQAFRWTESANMQTLNQWLSDSGVQTDGLVFSNATGVSADGNVVVGYGPFGSDAVGGKVFIARGGSGAISIDEFTQSFGTTASIQQTALSLPSVIMNGAHHHVLLEQNFEDKANMTWVTGDFANYDDRDADILTGEVGMAHDFGSNIRAGFGVGYGDLDQDLSYNGKQELDGHYIMAEVDYLIPDTSIILSFMSIYGAWDTDIKRGYENGGIQDSSRGHTDVDMLSGRLRADWVDAFELLGFNFTPRIAYTLTRIETDGYTETGGGFPAHFDSMSHDAHEIRVGLTGERELTEKTTIRGILEGVYRMDKDNEAFSGEVIGLFPFSIDGKDNNQTWMRVGGEISHQLRDNMMLTGTLFGAKHGEDPEVSGAINLNYLF